MSSSELALDGGTPVRSQTLPYGRQSIDDADIQAVVTALRSDFLTTGPAVGQFEAALADYVGAKEAVAVANGTAALHAMMACLGVGPGDEVIVPSLTFAASANSVAFCGGTPVFAEVEAHDLCLDPDDVAKKITPKTKAILPVDFAGQPADYARLEPLARDAGVTLLTDGAHALGGRLGDRPVGSLTHATTFSMHPVKTITCGEGGAIATDDVEFASKMRQFRHHGISKEHAQRRLEGGWDYDMVALGYNYRLTDFQCALGVSQLQRLDGFTAHRQALAARYDEKIQDLEAVRPLVTRPDAHHAYHLYIIRLDLEKLTVDRNQVFDALRAEGIGVNVHYRPVHLHPYYQQNHGTNPGNLPATEAVFREIITLPLFTDMQESDVDDVIEALRKVTRHYAR